MSEPTPGALRAVEPDPLDATLECPDCGGTGEVQVTVAAGYFGWEGQDTVEEECEACHGSGTARVGDLEAHAAIKAETDEELVDKSERMSAKLGLPG